MNDKNAKANRTTKTDPKTIPDFFGSLQYTNSATVGCNFSGWNQALGSKTVDMHGPHRSPEPKSLNGLDCPFDSFC